MPPLTHKIARKIKGFLATAESYFNQPRLTLNVYPTIMAPEFGPQGTVGVYNLHLSWFA